MPKEAKSNYALETSGRGASNFDLQNEILKENSLEQLKEAGLGPGMIVWNIGCGSGAMTEYMAHIVGPTGIVYAFDVSPVQIEVTKKRIQSAGYSNVRYIVGDIDRLDVDQYQKADIVYSRFLLMHVYEPSTYMSHLRSFKKCQHF